MFSVESNTEMMRCVTTLQRQDLSIQSWLLLLPLCSSLLLAGGISFLGSKSKRARLHRQQSDHFLQVQAIRGCVPSVFLSCRSWKVAAFCL